MPDKVFMIAQRKLVTRVTVKTECETCFEICDQDLKAHGMKDIPRHKPLAEFLIPYGWLHMPCPHHGDELFQSAWINKGKEDGQGTGKSGNSVTP